MQNADYCEKCQDGWFLYNNSCFKYTCENTFCYLTRKNDSIFSLYRYNLGDQGISLPAGINICYANDVCPYDSGTPICWKTGYRYNVYYTSSPDGCSQLGTSEYSPCFRTLCNFEAGKLAVKNGWRFMKPSDTADLDAIFYAQSKGLVVAQPFCYRRVNADNSIFLPTCETIYEACRPNYSERWCDPSAPWALNASGVWSDMEISSKSFIFSRYTGATDARPVILVK